MILLEVLVTRTEVINAFALTVVLFCAKSQNKNICQTQLLDQVKALAAHAFKFPQGMNSAKRMNIASANYIIGPFTVS